MKLSGNQAEANARFDESVEVAFNLGTDPRRGDQQVRGAVTVPYGTGKSVRVGVFADGEAAELARAAGVITLLCYLLVQASSQLFYLVLSVGIVFQAMSAMRQRTGQQCAPWCL